MLHPEEESVAGDPASNDVVIEQFCRRLAAEGYRGDILADEASRLLAATDNSVYQVLPLLVLAPLDGQDLDTIVRTASAESFKDLALTARGGGTGTNGQALTDAVVVDTSRHMNHILGIDVTNGTVRVEPGVVLGQLNDFLADHGLTFPPQISTASRATIGGMISTDACGKGSRVYGKTGDFGDSLRLLLADGRMVEARAYDCSELDQAATSRDPGLQLAARLRAVVDPVRQQVKAVFPKISRSLTGYNLRDAFPDDRAVLLHRLISGSEGTLGIIRDITLRIIPRPVARKLVVVRYRDLDSALTDCGRILRHEPAAIETLDEKLYDLARHDPSWGMVRLAMEGERTPARALATNFVEFIGKSEQEVDERLTRFVNELASARHVQGWHLAEDPADQKRIWGIRSRAVGLLGRTKGPRKPIAFVEDTVVPPDRLTDYIRDFRALLDRHGVEYGMFGHVDVGCLHVRPALDMTDEKDARLLRIITEEVVGLVKRYGGLLWGEHGKGYRGEFTQEFFGDTLYPVLGEIKRIFDPLNRLNPGKIVTPSPDSNGVVPIDGVPFRGALDGDVPTGIRAEWTKAFECNGNGVCFDWDATVPICPSYKVTRDRVHSPKGRAALVREWLREQQEPSSRRDSGIERQLYDSMANCLGCNACASQCPVHVAVPELRSRFLHRYHETHARPLRDRIMARIEGLASLGRKAPGLANALTANATARGLARQYLGVVDTPRFSVPSLARRLHHLAYAAAPGPKVALLLDPFTTSFDARVPEATIKLLRRLNVDVQPLHARTTGKAAHVHGYRGRFQRESEALMATICTFTDNKIPVLAIEPSIALFLRQECAAGPDHQAADGVFLINEWLCEAGIEGLPVSSDADGEAAYHLIPHCTEATAVPETGEMWTTVFRQFGLELKQHGAGCCGMAGTYGHLYEHQDRSRALFAMSWQTPAAEYRDRLLATGFSCRCQVGRLSGFRPRHPIEVLCDRVSGTVQEASQFA
ncbi:MAG: FAD-binding oxidoreductase [Ectothiorhodospiraceae bacterium]|nr:FAD-binding oxidoreductase [Ectothiorhodospiraceae bacterium]